MSAVAQEIIPLCCCLQSCSLVWVLASALAATLQAMAALVGLAIWVLGVAGWRPGLQLESARPHLMCRYFLGPGQQVPQVLALGLSSRKNLCIHPSVAGGDMPGLSSGIYVCFIVHVRRHHNMCIRCHGMWVTVLSRAFEWHCTLAHV